ncbi:DUF342 domain-containing protein [Caldalkalibacillus salinus]|uniref:DUF342 domain-containing protein n=1 Tax=Caldalkalibacillus salinus TaxID=2803787 RepID=UPI001922B6EE|nr:FapA family protein [Caldalkalibacillus salinus]
MQTTKTHDQELEGLQLTLSTDKLYAYLTVTERAYRRENELYYTKEALITYLQKQGVRYGILDKQIDTLVRSPKDCKDQRILVARGKPPVHGENTKLNYVYHKKNQTRLKEQADGRVDFFTVTEIPNVQKGQVLARKCPPTEGIAGKSVTEETIEAMDGREVPIKLGRHVVLDPSTDSVYAVIDGQVCITDRLNVYPVYEVPHDLDLSIGNIDFIGNVVIHGNVPSGFSVKAKGDIRVTGSVEGAELEAEGNVYISSGVTAQHQGYIKAGKDVVTKFVVNGDIHAQGSVYVSQTIMHSTVRAGQDIQCDGTKGLVIGGDLRAGYRFACRTIGNNMNTATRVEVGIDPSISIQQQMLEAERRSLNDELEKTDKAIRVIDQTQKRERGLPSEKKTLRYKLTNAKLEIEKKRRMVDMQYSELAQKRNELKTATIEVSGYIYPGSKLVFGKYVKFLKEPAKYVLFTLERNEIVTHPLQ